VVEITLPPLRSHKEDIPDLVAHFIATLAPQLGVAPIEITADEMTYLQQYDWPGNVRELRNLIERSLIVGCAQCLGAVPEPVAPRGARGPPGAGRPDRPAHAGEAPHPGGARFGGRRQDPGRTAAGHLAPHAGAARGRMGR
jgi:DNA-binding NtrC family response regulator